MAKPFTLSRRERTSAGGPLPSWLTAVSESAWEDDSATLVEWLARHAPQVEVLIALDERNPVERAHPHLVTAYAPEERAWSPRLVVVTPEGWEYWRGVGPWVRPWADMHGRARRYALEDVAALAAGEARGQDPTALALALAGRLCAQWASDEYGQVWDLDPIELLATLLRRQGPEFEERALFLAAFDPALADLSFLLAAYRHWLSRVRLAPWVDAVLADVEAGTVNPLPADPKVEGGELLRGWTVAALLAFPEEDWKDLAIEVIRAREAGHDDNPLAGWRAAGDLPGA